MKSHRSLQVLAVDGGEPLRRREWPAWPRLTSGNQQALLEAFHSGCWTVSAADISPTHSFERRYARRISELYGVPYCVPVSSGTAALMVGLEALGVSPGDSVLVPGISWVATASSVVLVGATPVPVDIDPLTLCMSLESASSAISTRTVAIILVHQNCSVADLEGFASLSQSSGVPIVEDCSQAHGATYNGCRVGTTGILSAFSMQQNKLLTCGEGGAILTSDPILYDRMQQARSNGRRYRSGSGTCHEMDLEEVGDLMGGNFLMTEFQAALLLEGLCRLDGENSVRAKNACYLDTLLATVKGVNPIVSTHADTKVSYHKYTVWIDTSEFGFADVSQIGRAVSCELGLPLEMLDRPMNANPLFNLRGAARLNAESVEGETMSHLKNATNAWNSCLTFRQNALLGKPCDMEDIAAAFSKVRMAFNSSRHR